MNQPGQDVGVLHDGQLRRLAVADGVDVPPLGEVTPVLLVLGAPDAEVIDSLSGRLTVGSGQFLSALVQLDAWKRNQDCNT